jgi:hypothetical protein
VIIVKELDVNQARMKNPVAFVRVQEKAKTTSTVDMFIYFRGSPNRVNASFLNEEQTESVFSYSARVEQKDTEV